jgi:hypothetical protein
VWSAFAAYANLAQDLQGPAMRPLFVAPLRAPRASLKIESYALTHSQQRRVFDVSSGWQSIEMTITADLFEAYLKLIFYSFGAILTRFTLLEFAKIENVVQLLKGECIFVLIRKYCALRGVESTSARDVFPSQAR